MFAHSDLLDLRVCQLAPSLAVILLECRKDHSFNVEIQAHSNRVGSNQRPCLISIVLRQDPDLFETEQTQRKQFINLSTIIVQNSICLVHTLFRDASLNHAACPLRESGGSIPYTSPHCISPPEASSIWARRLQTYSVFQIPNGAFCDTCCWTLL